MKSGTQHPPSQGDNFKIRNYEDRLEVVDSRLEGVNFKIRDHEERFEDEMYRLEKHNEELERKIRQVQSNLDCLAISHIVLIILFLGSVLGA